MGYLDEALSGYQPPTAESMDIVLPARREPSTQANAAQPAQGGAQARESGQHGGAAEGSAAAAAAAETHADTGGSGGSAAAAEPELQRDEPDDGEHTDSTAQQVAARAQAAQAARPEPQEPEALEDLEDSTTEPVEAETAAETETESTPQPEPAPKPLDMRRELAQIAGSEPRAFQKTGFSAGEVETTIVKRFPVPLVDRLRLSLAAAVGGEFAEALSAPALITAFLIAKTGVELDVDANTAVAVDVFRQVDPRLLAVENKLDEVMSDVSQLADAMKLGLKRIGETGTVVDGLEFSTAYLIADRVSGLTATDTNETNVDVTQKKVLLARENIRARTKAQRTVERQRDGRRMA